MNWFKVNPLLNQFLHFSDHFKSFPHPFKSKTDLFKNRPSSSPLVFVLKSPAVVFLDRRKRWFFIRTIWRLTVEWVPFHRQSWWSWYQKNKKDGAGGWHWPQLRNCPICFFDFIGAPYSSHASQNSDPILTFETDPRCLGFWQWTAFGSWKNTIFSRTPLDVF
jgi:hypothetical protein